MAYAYQKQILRNMYGGRCMLCERTLQKKKQTYHHRIPKANGGTNELKNGTILCSECQRIIHTFYYGTEAYTKLDELIAKNMRKYKKK